MSDKNKTQPKAFRITEETAEKFRVISQELGANQQQAMAKLIEVYEMEKGKESIPEMREDIDTFEGYMHAMVNMYMQALEANQNMRALVRTEYDSLLKSKDTIIEELQGRIQEAKKNEERISAMEQEYKSTIATAEAECEKLRTQLQEEKTAAEEKVAQSTDSYNNLKTMYEKLQISEEETKSILSSFMKENEKLKNENDTLQEERRNLEMKNLELAQKIENFTAEIEREKRQAQESQFRLQTEMEFFKKNCETEHQLQLQIQENELKDKHKQELDELRKELDKYKELYYQKVAKTESE